MAPPAFHTARKVRTALVGHSNRMLVMDKYSDYEYLIICVSFDRCLYETKHGVSLGDNVATFNIILF